MKRMTSFLCFVLSAVMILSLCSCGGQGKDKTPDNTKEKEKYIGTWQGSDHDDENVVHYLIFDNEGYWNVYMNYTPLVRAIKQLPEQLVSFKVFCQLQNSGQTRCYYEYVKNDGNTDFTAIFTVDEEGQLKENIDTDVYYTKVSTHSGEPDETIVKQAQSLFDRAREEALS